MHRPKRLGLVGPLASGKTAVLGMFGELGAATIAADDLSRDLLRPGAALTGKVIEVFGERYRRPDGSLDRGALAALIFADAAARRRLEAITHPPMLDEMRRRVERAERAGAPLIVVEAAVLYVMGADELVDCVALVTAEREERLRRLMQRDGLSRREAERRLDLHERLGLDAPPADYVIDTTAGFEQTHSQVLALWQRLVDDESSQATDQD